VLALCLGTGAQSWSVATCAPCLSPHCLLVASVCSAAVVVVVWNPAGVCAAPWHCEQHISPCADQCEPVACLSLVL
jgi:hypothetical protein